jgi:cytochrome b involved in lipid metabolism
MMLDIKWKPGLPAFVLLASLLVGAKFSVDKLTDGYASEARTARTPEDVAYLSPGEVSSLIQTSIGVNRRTGKALHEDAEEHVEHRKLLENLTALLEHKIAAANVPHQEQSLSGSDQTFHPIFSQNVSDLEDQVETLMTMIHRGGGGLLSAGATSNSSKPKQDPKQVVKLYKILSDDRFLANSIKLMYDDEFRKEVREDTGDKDPNRMVNNLLQHSSIVMSKYNDLMMPRVMDCRWIAIIGNVIILVVICIGSSMKSKYLTRSDKEGEQKVANLEKAMRRDVTVAEMKSHSLPGDIWVAVDGMVCDVSEFTANHPGGADVLLQHAGQDVSEQFAEVGHSAFAVELVKGRMVGVLTGSDEKPGDGAEGQEEPGALRAFARNVFPSQVLSLFTKEDPLQIHKILGVSVVVHYLVRFVIVIQGYWLLYSFPPGSADPMLFSGDWFSLASGWWCVLLQLSSFQFILPRNRVVGRPMLWQEWRAHNLIFVLRSLAGFTCGWYKMRYGAQSHMEQVLLSVLMFIAVYVQLYATDVASRNLRDSKHESLTASWPLWEGCPAPLERFIKFYYSIGINQLTYIVLQTASSELPSMYVNFAGVVILQSDSFMMTLVRKNIISTASFHAFYLWNMWHLAFWCCIRRATSSHTSWDTRSWPGASSCQCGVCLLPFTCVATMVYPSMDAGQASWQRFCWKFFIQSGDLRNRG